MSELDLAALVVTREARAALWARVREAMRTGEPLGEADRFAFGFLMDALPEERRLWVELAGAAKRNPKRWRARVAAYALAYGPAPEPGDEAATRAVTRARAAIGGRRRPGRPTKPDKK